MRDPRLEAIDGQRQHPSISKKKYFESELIAYLSMHRVKPLRASTGD